MSGRLRHGAFLMVTLLIAATLIYLKVRIQVSVGPGWDTYAFLNNAAEFAGFGTGYSELHRPPLLSWLVSLAIRATGVLSTESIQWMDGALSLSGIAAAYLLLCRRFPTPYAAVGSLALLGVSPLWQYLGSGYTDTPSVALSAWVILMLVYATEKHPIYYLVAAALFVAAVLTRYTALLIAFPALTWMVLRWSPFRQARYIGAAIGVAVATYIPAGRFYAQRFGDALFPFILAFGVSEAVSAPGGEGATVAAAPYYVTKLPEFLGGGQATLASVLLVFIAVIGITRLAGQHVLAARPKATRSALLMLGIGLALVAQAKGGMIVQQVTIPAVIVLIWLMLGRTTDLTDAPERVSASRSLDAVMLAWLLAYFSFHGHQTIQVPRYVITMAIPLLYFILLGWQGVATDVAETLSSTRARQQPTGFHWITSFATPLALSIIVAIALAIGISGTPRTPDSLVRAAEETADWLVANEPRLDEARIYSDLWPLTAWYAHTGATAMPFFKEEAAFQHELDKTEAEYYVTIRARRYDSYAETARLGAATILKRTGPAAPSLPRVALVGTAWNNYLESVADYSLYLDSDAGRYGWEGTAFLDALSANELSAYPTVAVYNVRWRQRANGEAALRTYIESGGVAIIDASANLGELPYELAGTVMFDTVIRRDMMDPDASVVALPDFRERHPEIGQVIAARFVDETGGGWYGAKYEALPQAESTHDVLVTANGKPIVSVQHLGEGRIYWVGYNLVWHAFFGESPSEQRLVQAIFDDALHDEGQLNE